MYNNYNNNNTPSGDITSWVVVIICLLAFWPLGLILLLRKVNFNQKKQGTAYSNYKPGQAPYQQRYAQQQPNQQYQAQHGANQQSYYAQQPHQTPQAPPQQQYRQQGGMQQPAAQQPFRPSGQVPRWNTRQAQQAYRAQQSYYAQQTNRMAQKEKKQAKKEKNQKGKGLAGLLTFLGIIFSITGVICVSTGLGSSAVAGLTGGALATFLVGVFFCLGGIISFLSRIDIVSRMHRCNKYRAIMGERDIASATDLAKAAGIPVKKLRRDLAVLADNGYFGASAYFDNSLDCLCLSSEAAEKARTEAGTVAGTHAPDSVANENEYVAIISELHMLCATTSDPSICAKITRIEEITTKIFKLIEEKPEKKPQLRRFMNYYLPTTLKLLHSYETLEKQGVKGENIMSAKQEIERVLDTLAVGFEQQLDNLFMSDKIDISADIDVLESMMEQDGLTNEGSILKTAGGN